MEPSRFTRASDAMVTRPQAKEYRTLRRYLKDHHELDADMSVVPIPMNVRPESVGFIATPAHRMLEVDESGNFGWYRLQNVAGTLPFTVAAWYVVGSSTLDDTQE
jgi:hypothetical protein